MPQQLESPEPYKPPATKLEAAVDVAVDIYKIGRGIVREGREVLRMWPSGTLLASSSALCVAIEMGQAGVQRLDGVVNGPWSQHIQAEQAGLLSPESSIVALEHVVGVGVGTFSVLAVAATMLEYRVNKRKSKE